MLSHSAKNDAHDAILKGIRVAGKPSNTYWNICCKGGFITSMEENLTDTIRDSIGQFLIPSLCHPHIHLDKCFLLSHPKYADLEIQKGDFAEAMSLTSEAKSRFEHDDLMERGRALIEESINFGVTHMRAFVEVDPGVGMKCLVAGLALKEEFLGRCYVQICIFAQDPIFSYEDGGVAMTGLLEAALQKPGVEVLGSTPYVEKNGEYNTQIKNIEWTIQMAKRYSLHLDFHIDYNLDVSRQSSILAAVELLYNLNWPSDPKSPDFRTVVFGHCTRLTTFDSEEWIELRRKIRDLPVSFVGLPTSDLFMMGRPKESSGGGQRVRGTLQIPQMIQKYGLNAATGINNVGNAFTPHGNCDPLSLASFGVGIYQAGTKSDAEILLQCVSGRAKEAIGLNLSKSVKNEFKVGDPADFVLFGSEPNTTSRSFRSRKTVQELVYDAGHDRVTVFRGKSVSHSI